jgi:FKBP-type peptidyl-prolyl cis-trans isomerase
MKTTLLLGVAILTLGCSAPSGGPVTTATMITPTQTAAPESPAAGESPDAAPVAQASESPDAAASPADPGNPQPPKAGETGKVKSEGGLSYTIVKEGADKRTVAKGDQVQAHYTGWLTDGTKFDSSLDRGQPFPVTVGVGMVIPGWDQGLQGMKVGETRRLYIPSKLAYGESGTPGGPIPPNADLVFEVTIMDIPGKK